MLKTVKNQFHTARDAQFFEDLGTGRLRWVSIGCATTAILNLALGFTLGTFFGATAIVAASASSLAAGYVLVVFFYHRENHQLFRELLPRESAWIVLSSVGGVLVFLPIFCASSASSLYSLRTASGLLVAALITIFIPMWIHPMRKRVLHWVLARVPT